MITKTKPSQQLKATPSNPHIWDLLLLGIGTPPEKFLYAPANLGQA